jgi:LEA14-like dessication related protein
MHISIQYKKLWYLFAIAFFFSSCKFTEPTFGKFNLQSMQPKKDGNYTIELSVEVNNPNNYNIWVKGGNMDILMSKEKMGNVKTKGTVVLKKQKKDTYIIKAETKFDPNSSILTVILNGGNKSVTLKGSIKAGVFIVGKKFDIEFSDKLPSMNIFGN